MDVLKNITEKWWY